MSFINVARFMSAQSCLWAAPEDARAADPVYMCPWHSKYGAKAVSAPLASCVCKPHVIPSVLVSVGIEHCIALAGNMEGLIHALVP